MKLNQLIDFLPNTSPITIKRLKSIDIKTIWNLLNYFPFRYENYSLLSQINQLQEGETVTIRGQITEAKYEITKKGTKIQKFFLDDKTGRLELVWYNQPYLLKLIKPGMNLSVAGEIKRFGNRLIIEPKEYELIKDYQQPKIHTGKIIPIYPEKRGLSSRTIREKIFYILSQLTSPGQNLNQDESLREFLPKEIIVYNELLDIFSAYQNIHFPQSFELAKKARQRLAFDELFIIQLSAALIKKEWQKEKVGHPFDVSIHRNLIQKFIESLPFQLTNAQNKVIKEILDDLSKKIPMNRFLQGDVGSGKTVVAAVACYLAYLNGYQSLVMAPTEILANQHYQTISKIFLSFNVKVALITGGKKYKISSLNHQEKKSLDNKSLIINSDIIIGTHALLNQKLKFERVGLVIIDEQHRFGVVQRAILKEKGINPHLLTMTATPIPRTVALTLYGELNVSYLDEMPKNRLPVKTFLVPKEKRAECYQWIKKEIKKTDNQVFIVCPLIDESIAETMKSIKAAKKEYENLKKIFDKKEFYYNLSLLHGKMKTQEKNQIMEDFKNKKIDILVTTPVVEVGIDIPNATIIIIEAAERFGLAQLHQLRGRVGRSDKQSYCFMFTENQSPEIKNRLEFFARNHLGIKLAEYDLIHRGPGEIYGTKQHGFINLKIASLTDYKLIEKTKKAVLYFLNRYQISQFEELKKRVEEYNIKQIARD